MDVVGNEDLRNGSRTSETSQLENAFGAIVFVVVVIEVIVAPRILSHRKSHRLSAYDNDCVCVLLVLCLLLR